MMMMVSLLSFLPPSSSDVALTFSPPVTLPIFCPQALCRYGGQTAADSFHTFSTVGGVLGVVNRTVVFSGNSGASWETLHGVGEEVELQEWMLSDTGPAGYLQILLQVP